MAPPRTVLVPLILLLGVSGCSRLYPPVVETADTPAPGGSTPPVRPRGAQVQLLPADDPDYLALQVPPGVRSVPDAPERLLVLRDGNPVLDLGVRTVRADQAGRVALEEEVRLAEDASAAVVVRVERKRGAPEQSLVTWVPAGDPQAAWKKTLDPARRVLLALPIPGARGLVLVTAVPEASDDLRVYGPGGAETFRLGSDAAGVSELRASRSGRYVAADLSYPPRPGAPDRAIWVHDTVARTAWTHGWSYGAEDEVIGWRLMDDGTLEADTAGSTLEIGPGDRVYDRKRRR
jgi:hypothetical protein